MKHNIELAPCQLNMAIRDYIQKNYSTDENPIPVMGFMQPFFYQVTDGHERGLTGVKLEFKDIPADYDHDK